MLPEKDRSSTHPDVRQSDEPRVLRTGVSVVIPVYNGALAVQALVDRTRVELARLAVEHEIILVNDGSRDASWRQIARLTDLSPIVLGIDLMRNYGQHAALLAGVRAARYDIVVTMDDDLQHRPEDIGRLIVALDEGFDVVYGTAASEERSIWRRVASRFTKLALAAALGADVAPMISSFRAFRTVVRDAFATFGGPYVCLDVLLAWGTSRFASVKVPHVGRQHGRSHYTFWKLVLHGLNLLTGFSTLPLHFASILGFLFTAFGILVLSYVMVAYLLQGGSVPGFPFLASVIAIFSGAQLFALGIIGQYLARIHYRTMDRPSYVVRAMATSKGRGPSDRPPYSDRDEG